MNSGHDDYLLLLLRDIQSEILLCDSVIRRYQRYVDNDMDFESDSIQYREYVDAVAMRQALTYLFNKFCVQYAINPEEV